MIPTICGVVLMLSCSTGSVPYGYRYDIPYLISPGGICLKPVDSRVYHREYLV